MRGNSDYDDTAMPIPPADSPAIAIEDFAMTDAQDPHFQGTRQIAWILLLVAASLAFTLGFACATPLAGIAVVAALTLRRPAAAAVVALVWLANQAAGFGVLGYPRTANAAEWGVAIGVASLLSLAAATGVAGMVRTKLLREAACLAASFAVFEVALYAASAASLGGLDAYTPDIVGRIFAINAIAAVGLLALGRVLFRPAVVSLAGPQMAGKGA